MSFLRAADTALEILLETDAKIFHTLSTILPSNFIWKVSDSFARKKIEGRRPQSTKGCGISAFLLYVIENLDLGNSGYHLSWVVIYCHTFSLAFLTLPYVAIHFRKPWYKRQWIAPVLSCLALHTMLLLLPHVIENLKYIMYTSNTCITCLGLPCFP